MPAPHPLLQELRQLQRDYIIEVYTQAEQSIRIFGNGTRHHIKKEEYMHTLQQHIGPNMVLLADKDVLWSFSQTVTADIFVHSKSTLSIAAVVFNTQVRWAVFPPAAHTWLL